MVLAIETLGKEGGRVLNNVQEPVMRTGEKAIWREGLRKFSTVVGKPAGNSIRKKNGLLIFQEKTLLFRLDTTKRDHLRVMLCKKTVAMEMCLHRRYVRVQGRGL